jgi:hypothetical protein
MQKKDPTQNNQQLGNLLLRYKKLIKPPQQTVVAEVVLVVKEIVGVDVRQNQFTYAVSSRTLYVKSPSIIKTEILRAKNELLKALRERLGENNSPVDFV